MPVLTKADEKERKTRAKEWVKFRKENLMTQNQLASVLGINKWTVFNVENARVTPQMSTLAKFKQLQQRYSQNGDN